MQRNRACQPGSSPSAFLPVRQSCWLGGVSRRRRRLCNRLGEKAEASRRIVTCLVGGGCVVEGK